MNKSLWLTYKKNKFNKLNKNIDVDVLIIGGGITGLSIAYQLKNSDLKVALVERNKIGTGITSKSTAKITYLQENIYSTLRKYYEEDKVKLYLDSQIDAIKIITNIIKDNNIDCDLERSNSYLFTDKNIKKINKEYDLLKKYNINVTKEKIPNEKCLAAIKVTDTYTFNPIKYLDSISNIIKDKIKIYEETKIINIEKDNNQYICSTPTNTIKTKYVVLALHYNYFLFPFFMPSKTTLEKSYISAYKVDKDWKYNAINIDKPIKSIRYYKDKNNIYKIELTGSHNISTKNNEENNFNKLDKKQNQLLWSNIDIMTNDYLPFIGKINDNLLLATGYNTWGMTNGTIAGKIISDIILDKENKYTELFNPNRMNIARIINLPISLSSNIYSFVKNKIKIKKDWYNNIKFETINDKLVATYIDNKTEYSVIPICPHLKCTLIFNEQEKTWDCPCHGSRFDITGKCIEGPSNYNISYKKDI